MLESRKQKLRRQIQESRYRLIVEQPEFAKPLYAITYVATKDVWRISTNGRYIYFDPDWLQKLNQAEIDFMLSHLLMHIHLGHIDRPQYYQGDRYHLAADIVSNAKLREHGWTCKKLPHIGKIRDETIFPCRDGAELTSVEAIRYIPVDPSALSATERRQFMMDSEEWWDRKTDRGEHGTIVLSSEDEDPEDLQYESTNTEKNGVPQKEEFPDIVVGEGGEGESRETHGKPPEGPDATRDSTKLTINRLRQEMQTSGIGQEPGWSEREWARKNAKTIAWKNLLHTFVQEEVNDYSFMPPDRRMQGEFFLPDYNVPAECVRDILFLVDTSGSIKDKTLCMAYDEIRQAIEQFGGAMSGTVAFFDTKVYRPMSFASASDLSRMRPIGGGGTDYSCIFQYLREGNINTPSSIVIITDGDGTYPNSAVADNLPILWLISSENETETPPFGRVARI